MILFLQGCTFGRSGAEGETTLASCRDTVGEGCYWRYRATENRCNDKHPCDKLVVLFSGGDMGCAGRGPISELSYGKVLARYADEGYVAVCAGLFETSEGSGRLPFAAESSRFTALMTSITSSPEINRIWTGRRLLIAGVSHGASAPVVAMARQAKGISPGWLKGHAAAACFYDGTYNVTELDEFFQGDASGCRAFRNRMICRRYFGKDDCPTPVEQNAAVRLDTLTDFDAAALGIRRWKLIECGSATTAGRCNLLLGDGLPMGPIKALCSRINDAAGHSCQFGSLPTSSHTFCSLSDDGIDECRLWFDKLQALPAD